MTPATTARRPATDVPGRAPERPLAPIDRRTAVLVRAAEAGRPAPRTNPATSCGVADCIRLRGHDGLHRATDASVIDGPIRSWAMER